MSGTFKCPVPDSLQGKVTAIQLKAERSSEPPEKTELPYQGVFGTDFVDLTLVDGSSVKIKLEEAMGFSATNQTLHEGCNGFRWKSLGDLTIFEYIYGPGNPYPAQQLLYSRGAMRGFANLLSLFKGSDAFFESDKSNCLTGLVKGDGEVEKWCYQEGKFYLSRKMLIEPYSEKSEYHFICDFTAPDVRIVESILKTGLDRVPVESANHEVLKVLTSRCVDIKAGVKPIVVAASE